MPDLQSGMELRQLRYFVAVAQGVSFTRAALQLNTSQQNLSKQIRALEEELGPPLMHRGVKGVDLTDASTVALREAVQTLAQADRLKNVVGRQTGQQRLRLGTLDWASGIEVFNDIVSTFRAQLPQILLDLDPVPWPYQEQAVQQGSIDVGFTIAGDADDFEHDIGSLQLNQEVSTLYAVVDAHHPLSERPALHARDLLLLPMILFPRPTNPMLHDRVMASLNQAGLQPTLAAGLPVNLPLTIQLAASGGGWIPVMPSLAATPLPGTAVVPISDAHLQHGLYLLWHAGTTSALVQAFVRGARDGLTGAPRVGTPSML